MVYSTRRFVVCLSVCHFVLVFFCPFSIAITSLGEERANLSAFRTFVRFVLVWICRFPFPLGVWEGLRFVTVALPGLFSYLFFYTSYWQLPYLSQRKAENDRINDFMINLHELSGRSGIRTCDHWLCSQMCHRLSYGNLYIRKENSLKQCRICIKYSDILTSYLNCPKTWTSQ